MKPTSYVAVGEATSPKFCQAFATGCGGDIVADGQLRPGPVALFGSPQRWAMLNQAIAEGRNWYYGDHAYFGRFQYYRVTKNAYQHDGTPLKGLNRSAYRRWEQHGVQLADWRKNGDHIVICPPDVSFAQLHNFNATQWLAHVIETLIQYTTRSFRVRRRHGNNRPLSRDLEGAWALVTYTSNAAVEALCAGVPTFCLGRCGASALSLHDLTQIEAPIYPSNRLEWAATLACSQWTLKEITAGKCWEAIR